MFAKTRLALMIGCITGGFSVMVHAEEATISSTPNDTVVVTSQMQSGATKLETPDIETPQSVSIVTRQQFEEQGATSVRQAVTYTPGVYANQIGASNRFDYIVMRGFSDGSLDNIYLDGLKMMGDTNSHSSLVVDPWFLDSVEVVRGPASVLYGRSSPGGIVALNSRKPSFDAGGQVKLFAGNNNQRGAAFDVTGPVDDNDRVAVRLSGMTRYADSQFGKTTAALGLALRARGAGLSVLFIQFLKNGDFSEIKALASLGGITVEQYGSSGFYRPENGNYIEHRGYSKKGYTRALTAVNEAAFDLVICDEIISAFGVNLVTYEELLALTAAKAPPVELVLTGRGAPSGLYDCCDLVTDMTAIKHYYDAGVAARTGIEM